MYNFQELLFEGYPGPKGIESDEMVRALIAMFAILLCCYVHAMYFLNSNHSLTLP